MGRRWPSAASIPDLVLCSSARRTRDTLALVLPELKAEPKVIYDDALYHASPGGDAGDAAGRAAERVRSVLLVGHNPEIQTFALDLIGSGPKHSGSARGTKYPTAGSWCSRLP